MIKGFSRLSKEEKRQYIHKNYLSEESRELFSSILDQNSEMEKLIDGLSENVISSFCLPYSVSPNYLIDGKEYTVPMVTEESSVVAAASKSAGFWYRRGGFKTEILGTTKTGQVHFKYNGEKDKLDSFFSSVKKRLFESVKPYDYNMAARGGGIQYIKLLDKSGLLENLFQIEVGFNTCNAMGANYMNSCLEEIATNFKNLSETEFSTTRESVDVIMSILSNYSPENAVRVFVECPVQELDDGKLGMQADEFAGKFSEACNIAEIDVYRAVTHNKGLFNGIDAVALATGNDWRAIEANGHAYAVSQGQYKSLSKVVLSGGIFRFEAIVPLQVGTIGGITNLHPLTKVSMAILGKPSATELMKVMAAVGLASNFAAIKSLITTGIQKGHMKMHLNNILAGLNASAEESSLAKKHFAIKTVTFAGVKKFLQALRNNSPTTRA